MRLVDELFGIIFIIGRTSYVCLTKNIVSAFKYLDNDCEYCFLFYNVSKNCLFFLFCFPRCWNKIKGSKFQGFILYETNYFLFLLSSRLRSSSCKWKSSMKYGTALSTKCIVHLHFTVFFVVHVAKRALP